VRAIFLGVAALEATLHLVEFCLLAQERIEQAQEDWKTGKFAPVPGETEFL
jgi:redox-sensitive bicupin YhaK (pirin superfamily)